MPTNVTYVSNRVLREMSQTERNEYMDRLVSAGLDDGPDWGRLFRVWERLEG